MTHSSPSLAALSPLGVLRRHSSFSSSSGSSVELYNRSPIVCVVRVSKRGHIIVWSYHRGCWCLNFVVNVDISYGTVLPESPRHHATTDTHGMTCAAPVCPGYMSTVRMLAMHWKTVVTVLYCLEKESAYIIAITTLDSSPIILVLVELWSSRAPRTYDSISIYRQVLRAPRELMIADTSSLCTVEHDERKYRSVTAVYSRYPPCLFIVVPTRR